MADDNPDLQSKDSCHIVDIINRLSQQSPCHHEPVDLPRIILCGDQSSGKSSVLEAISGLPFATQDGLSTRFVIEVILRRSTLEERDRVMVYIIPGPGRTEVERTELGEYTFDERLEDLAIATYGDAEALDEHFANESFEDIVLDARDFNMSSIIKNVVKAIGLTDSNEAFCTDILRIELYSSTQPHLMLVDLPGLVPSSTDNQSEDAKTLQSLAQSYMDHPRSIILPVVSASNDFSNQNVTQLAKKSNPAGHRTLGIITKPDTLRAGSEREERFLDLARNIDSFQLGWHVLKNRDSQSLEMSDAERDEAEVAFFSEKPWSSLDMSYLGSSALRTRLSRVLHDQILTQVPPALDDMEWEINDCKTRLANLGPPRSSIREQRQHLLDISQGVNSLIDDAIYGDYTNWDFFGDDRAAAGSKRRFRDYLEYSLGPQFQGIMCQKGHAKIIVEDESGGASSLIVGRDSRRILRSQFIEDVTALMSQNPDGELPGTFNPIITGKLVSQQCRPWQVLTKRWVSKVMSIARTIVSDAIVHTSDAETEASLRPVLIEPRLSQMEIQLGRMAADFLKPYLEGRPIACVPSVMREVREMEKGRHQRAVDKLTETLASRSGDDESRASCELLDTLDDHGADLGTAILKVDPPPLVKTWAANTALSLMEAHYKLALRIVIPQLIKLVKDHLIQHLRSIMPRDATRRLSDVQVRKLASETDEKIEQRIRTRRRLRVLEGDLAELRRLKGRSSRY